MRALREILRNYRRELILGPGFKFLEAVFELLLPLVMAKALEAAMMRKDMAEVHRWLLLLLLFVFSGAFFSFLCQYMASVASQACGTELRNRLLGKIHRLPMEEMEGFGTAFLLNGFNQDIEKIQQMIAFTIRLLVRAPFICIGALILSFTVHARLAWILFLVVFLFSITLKILISKSMPLYLKAQQQMERLIAQLSDLLAGMRVIRAFRGREREQLRFAQENERARQASFRLDFISGFHSVAVLFFLNVAELLILYWGGVDLLEKGILKTDLIVLINYLNQIIVALLVVADLAVLFPQGLAAAKRLQQVFDAEEMKESEGQREAQRVSVEKGLKEGLDLEVKSLSYCYPQASAPALCEISFRLEAGQSLGILGGTGSGKSTLLSLLMGYYLPSEGEVWIGNRRLMKESAPSWRLYFSYVPQKNHLLLGTLKESLLPTDRPESLTVPEALDMACVDFVKWPEEGDREVLQGGRNFSGGQRQRLCIARALLQIAPFLILDDALSALDFVTAARLRQNLREAKKLHFQSKITASQRVDAVRRCDLILLLEEGKLLAKGTHEELVEACPTYRKMYQTQMGGGEAERNM